MMRWRIHYHDGSTFSDLDGPPEAAPGVGVIAIVQAARATGHEVLHGTDFFVWKDGPLYAEAGEDGRWYATTQDALWFYLARPGWKKVLFGEYVSDEVWNRVLVAARNDPNFPHQSARKSGWREVTDG